MPNDLFNVPSQTLKQLRRRMSSRPTPRSGLSTPPKTWYTPRYSPVTFYCQHVFGFLHYANYRTVPCFTDVAGIFVGVVSADGTHLDVCFGFHDGCCKGFASSSVMESTVKAYLCAVFAPTPGSFVNCLISFSMGSMYPAISQQSFHGGKRRHEFVFLDLRLLIGIVYCGKNQVFQHFHVVRSHASGLIFTAKTVFLPFTVASTIPRRTAGNLQFFQFRLRFLQLLLHLLSLFHKALHVSSAKTADVFPPPAPLYPYLFPIFTPKIIF